MTTSGITVLFLATDAHGGFGGISKYNSDVIDAMCGMPSIATVIVLTRSKPATDAAPPSKSIYDLASCAGNRAYLMRCAAHLITAKIDLVYCAHINLLPLAATISRVRRVPLVLAIYGIDAWEKPKRISAGWGLDSVSLTLSISQVTLDRFRAWSNFPSEKCALMPNALHAEDFAMGPKDNPLARRLGVANRTTITTFGRMASFERYKGFDEVLNIMARLVEQKRDIVYVAAGDGNDRRRLEAEVDRLNLRDCVVFTGKIAESEKADLYRLTDAYVMPSSGEGFGFVVLEALACGIPVVASTVDGTREALRDGELGLIVNPRDPVALEEAVLKALCKPKGIPLGLDYFSFANFKRRLANALRTVVRV
jgi:phosphatidylinositol alpha-1,6-mannosyltransferase